MRKEQVKMVLIIAEDYLRKLEEPQVLQYSKVYPQWRVADDNLIVEITCMKETGEGYQFRFELPVAVVEREDWEGRFVPTSTVFADYVDAYQRYFVTLREAYQQEWRVSWKPVSGLDVPDMDYQLWGHLHL